MPIDKNIQDEFAGLLQKFQQANSFELRDHLYRSPWTKERPKGPYPWQVQFHNAGKKYLQRGILAGNRSGKTLSGAAEISFHLTGDYPVWWRGRRFYKPTQIWCCSESNEASRDIVQAQLFGGMGDLWGTGMIPKRYLDGCDPSPRQCGVRNVIDHCKVRHASGGYSVAGFKTYEMGRAKIQGVSLDVGWCDEEPPADFYSELMTRLADRKGIMIATFTPLKGVGDVVSRFIGHEDTESVWMKTVGWDDAPHLDEETKRQMLEGYQEYEIEARTKGLPTMGIGVIFPFHDDTLKVDPFEIPDHWAQICGIDFGINHPAAAVWLAIDRDAEMVYVTDCYKMSNEGLAYHGARINAHPDSDWIPVAWPHDGENRESDGRGKAEKYRDDLGVNMLPMSARHHNDKGGRQPTSEGLDEMYDLMTQGRFKVFSHLHEWFKEKSLYHRDDKNRVVAKNDDIMDATRYGLMMRRFARSRKQHAAARELSLTGAGSGRYDPLSAFD